VFVAWHLQDKYEESKTKSEQPDRAEEEKGDDASSQSSYLE